MTDMPLDEFDFGSSQGAAVAKESNKGGDFQREVMFLTLDATESGVRQGKDRAIVRLVTEYEQKPWMQQRGVSPWSLAWITVAQHYAPTKHRPAYAKEGQTWPEKMGAGCRKDKVFARKFANSCYLCDTLNSKASDRTWALGIEREQVTNEHGQIIGIRDKTREVLVIGADGKAVVTGKDASGKDQYAKKVVPAWVVLNFGWKNFYGPLSGVASYRQTVLDRDYVVVRTGSGNNDTSYSFIPLDPISLPEGAIEGVPAGPYDMGRIVGEKDGHPVPLAEVLYPEMPDLRRLIAERVSEEYFGRWFLPNWQPEGFDPSQAGGAVQNGVQTGYVAPMTGVMGSPPEQPATPAPQTPPTAEPSASALDALKARVTGGAGQFVGAQQGSGGQG